MAVNKGLLFGAALANGVNAFLDAREKGDLQRQRQALATVEQQMKQQPKHPLLKRQQKDKLKYPYFKEKLQDGKVK